jgi:carbon storage regulator
VCFFYPKIEGTMLVLTRKIGETVNIGNDIVITVLSQQSGKVRVGIDAPKDMKILRGELPDRGPVDETS